MPKPIQWNGKQYRPAKFNEGYQPGTVDDMLIKRQESLHERRLRQWQKERDAPIRQPPEPILRMFGKWLKGIFRRQ